MENEYAKIREECYLSIDMAKKAVKPICEANAHQFIPIGCYRINYEKNVKLSATQCNICGQYGSVESSIPINRFGF